MPRSQSLVNQHHASDQAKRLRKAVAKDSIRSRARYLCVSQAETAEFLIDVALPGIEECHEDNAQVRGEAAFWRVWDRVRGENVALQYNVAEIPANRIQLLRLVEIYELCVEVAEKVFTEKR